MEMSLFAMISRTVDVGELRRKNLIPSGRIAGAIFNPHSHQPMNPILPNILVMIIGVGVAYLPMAWVGGKLANRNGRS